MRFFSVLFALLLLASVSFAAGPVKPTPHDKCPVCGMFVAKYPDFLCELIFKDGSHAVFDGAKDMFLYYLNMHEYDASRKAEEVDSVYVTDYYGLTPVDGRAAFFVIGGDVTGPMGKELIPFEKRGDAEEFMSDHRGTKILKFEEVRQDTLETLK